MRMAPELPEELKVLGVIVLNRPFFWTACDPHFSPQLTCFGRIDREHLVATLVQFRKSWFPEAFCRLNDGRVSDRPER
jgi:hypothetical protein